jgi:hypothetical protein
LKTDSTDLSDSQRGYSSANYVYLIIFMMPSDIHIYLQSIGSYVLHQRIVKFKLLAGEGTSCAITDSLVVTLTLHSLASRQLLLYELSSRLVSQRLRSKALSRYALLALSLTRRPTHSSIHRWLVRGEKPGGAFL